ncbi:uncharacterized protein LOC107628985 isoform X1 [Arachis ipaensis]|uniref:uncharacterized protein LOC107628985 isoform X1 n=2 Tax=Arachis ipaensis TaxID=130454 RepID=UPI000A2B1865|nr:uncharacterized protein LOC107628985 isoform X1 [Arachis ipaensis]
MSDREDSDSDAPEEFTALQGIQQDEEIRKIQKESKASYKSKESKDTAQAEDDDVSGSKPQHNSNPASGFLPDDVVKMLAAREKQVFLPYYEGEEEKAKTKPAASKKRKSKKSGLEPVILSELGPPQCLQGALEFLKKRKMSVQRSSSALNNSNRAFRLLSKSGVILQKR